MLPWIQISALCQSKCWYYYWFCFVLILQLSCLWKERDKGAGSTKQTIITTTVLLHYFVEQNKIQHLSCKCINLSLKPLSHIKSKFFFFSGGCGYLVEAPSCRILLTGSELLQLSIQDVHQLLHQPHWGADVPGKDGAFGVLGQLVGQVCCIFTAADLQGEKVNNVHKNARRQTWRSRYTPVSNIKSHLNESLKCQFNSTQQIQRELLTTASCICWQIYGTGKLLI